MEYASGVKANAVSRAALAASDFLPRRDDDEVNVIRHQISREHATVLTRTLVTHKLKVEIAGGAISEDAQRQYAALVDAVRQAGADES
jgi:hypothetical protein